MKFFTAQTVSSGHSEPLLPILVRAVASGLDSFWYHTSALQSSWGKGDWEPRILGLPHLGRASSDLWVGGGRRRPCTHWELSLSNLEKVRNTGGLRLLIKYSNP